MVLDTSALIAVLLDEPESAALAESIEADPRRLISAGTLLETAMVIEARHGESGGRDLDLLTHKIQAEIVSFTYEQTEVARAAFRKFGKGRHRARLNLGDCFAYALSRVSGEKLLFKGDDFVHTDVEAVC